MAAVWFKYPNPHAEHVRSIDTLDQRVCPDTGEVHMERLIAVQQTAPAWIRKVRGIFDQKLLGVTDTTYVRELIRFDPRTPAVDMESAKYAARLTQSLFQRLLDCQRAHPVLSWRSQRDSL